MMTIIILSLLIIIIACFIYIWYLKYFKKYTRERFAFTGVTVMTTLVSALLIQIYSSQGFVSAIIKTSNFVLNTNISSYQTDLKDHILTIIIFYFLMDFILKLHKNWDGPISEISFEKKKYNESQSIYDEALLQLKDIVHKKKAIQIHLENEKQFDYAIIKQHEDEKLPWHVNVYELLTYSNNQYKIAINEDYYPDEKCFISTYGINDEHIAILCVIDYPNDSSIRNFVMFTKKTKIKFAKHIIAIKNHEDEIKIIEKYDTEIIIKNENEMLFSLIDFSSYKHYIKEQFTKKEITTGIKYTLKDIYVPLHGHNEGNEPINDVEKYILNWSNSKNENKHLAILGEYGCGKSVLSLKLTHELLDKRTKDNRVPILIELRGKSPRNLSITDILSTWGAPYRIEATSLLKLLKAGKLVLIFEGFDEMDMVGDREIRLNHFQRIWEFAIPNSKIIITGRPNFFLDDREMKMNLGIHKSYDESQYCEAINLEKFKINQIKLALRAIDNITKEQVVEILEKENNTNFYDLVSRPAILFLVAVIWKERELSKIKENINSAIVISEFIKYSYARQSKKNILFPLTEREREYFMLGIAIGMMRISEFSNQINKKDLENLILKLYKNFPIEINASDSAIQPKRKNLKQRMIDNNQAEETILTDVRSCGILVNDLSRIDYFKFAHKSFLEYQVSLYFVESMLQDKGENNIIMNSISKSLEVNISNFKHSKETISFTSEILIYKLNYNITDDPFKVCKSLFSLLYPYKLLSKYPKIAAIYDMYIQTTSFTYFILIPTTSVIFKILLKKSNLQGYLPILLIMFVLSLAVLIVLLSKIFIKRNIKGTKIWLKCCNQLNISESIITNVISKRYLMFLKGKDNSNPLNYIVRKVLISVINSKRKLKAKSLVL